MGQSRLFGYIFCAATVLAGLAGCSCDRAVEREIYADLVNALAAPGPTDDAVTVDFSKHRGPGNRRLRGFAQPRADQRRGRAFSTNREPRVSVVFDAQIRATRALRLEARALRVGRKGSRELRLELNGVPVSTLVIGRKLDIHTTWLPGALLRPGMNSVEFVVSEDDPVQAGREIAFYSLEIDGGDAAVPIVNPDRRLLVLPYDGSGVSIPISLRSGSRLQLGGVTFRGEGQLDVLVRTDKSSRPRLVVSLSAGGEDLDLDLGVAQDSSVRLELRAMGDSSSEGAGVLLTRPELSAPVERVAERAGEVEETRPHIIFYLVDTVRADRLGCYGYKKPISPAIDAFADRAVLFERAIGQSSWTRSSVASVFTGQWPVTHGALTRSDKLPNSMQTLAEALAGGGYETVGWVTNPNVYKRFGLAQGFHTYEEIHEHSRSNFVTDRVLDWLAARQEDDPLFLYIHTIDPHDRYEPSQEFLQRFAPDSAEFMETVHLGRTRYAWPRTPEGIAHLSDLYDAEIAENDRSFGALMEGLRSAGIFDDALIVFLSDHGEEFYEHGRNTHGKSLYGETLDFPLIVKFPGQVSGLRSRSIVQHSDLLPTVFDLVGLPVPAAVEGRSFAAVQRGQELADNPGPVYSYLELDGKLVASVVDGDWKLIRIRMRGGEWLYALFNLAEDPAEQRDLTAEMPIRVEVMAAQLEARILASQAVSRREEAEIDEDMERRLRALGYL